AQLVDQRIRHVLDHREAARHVAVERGVAHADLALVARGQHEPAELVRERHEQRAADARLDVFLGDVFLEALEWLRERLQEALEDRRDRQPQEVDAEVLRQPPRVLQPRPEDRVEIEIRGHHLLDELPPARHRLTVRIDDHAGAVEHQLVLAAHHVDERQPDDVVGGARGDHALAEAGLARVVRRAVDGHDQLGAGQRLRGRRPRRIPDVLADVDGHARLAEREDRRLAPRLEIAVLVEDAVVRQVLLVVDAGQGPVVDDGGGVEEILALVHAADDGGEAARRLRHVRQRGQVGLDEGGLEEEILGRVAGDRQLGERDEVGTERTRLRQTVHDAPGVTLDVPDGRVDLGQAHAEAPHAGYCNRAVVRPAPNPGYLAGSPRHGAEPTRHPRVVTFRGLFGQSTTIQNSSSLRIGCGTRQAGHIAVSVFVSKTGSSKLMWFLHALTVPNPLQLHHLRKAATINNDGCRVAWSSARACEALVHSGKAGAPVDTESTRTWSPRTLARFTIGATSPGACPRRAPDPASGRWSSRRS